MSSSCLISIPHILLRRLIPYDELAELHDQPADPFRLSSDDRDKPATLPDLPPVEPPSAGFVVQLFVIPAAVVVVVIIVWLLFGKLAGGERDAIEYVRQLRSPTANWRLAFELASLIQHDAQDRQRSGVARRARRPARSRSRPARCRSQADAVSGALRSGRSRLSMRRPVPARRSIRSFRCLVRCRPSIQRRSGLPRPPAWQSKPRGWTASSKTRVP